MGFYGAPCFTYLASYILVVAQADLHFCRVCGGGTPAVLQTKPGQRGIVPLLVPDQLGPGLIRVVWQSDLRHTIETDSRAWPAFELDVDSPGATRSCVLLVRGTLTFQSFRRLPSQAETGRTCDVYNGQLVHPCRVQSFRKAVSVVMDDLRPTSCS